MACPFYANNFASKMNDDLFSYFKWLADWLARIYGDFYRRWFYDSTRIFKIFSKIKWLKFFKIICQLFSGNSEVEKLMKLYDLHTNAIRKKMLLLSVICGSLFRIFEFMIIRIYYRFLMRFESITRK